ncbi:MAG: hypothetical protein DRZ82_01380 [Thermoprotei archaeon]|nr:MAG: hypothetical protein DRZ82_01380 [Thermoprotei archaeon]
MRFTRRQALALYGSLMVIVSVLTILLIVSRNDMGLIIDNINITDMDGIPCLLIRFNSSFDSLHFQLLSSGNVISSCVVKGDENVAMLKLFEPYANILEERHFTIRVLHRNTVIYTKEVSISGAIPIVNILSISASTLPSFLLIRSIMLEVKNVGDCPLYLSVARGDIQVFLDGNRVFAIYSSTIKVPPNASRILSVRPLIIIPSSDLNRKHEITIKVLNITINYHIPPLNPMIKLLDVNTSNMMALRVIQNMTISVVNSWIFPIDLRWMKILIDGKEFSMMLWHVSPRLYIINPGDEVQLHISNMFVLVDEPSVEVRLVLGLSEDRMIVELK